MDLMHKLTHFRIVEKKLKMSSIKLLKVIFHQFKCIFFPGHSFLTKSTAKTKVSE